MRQGPKASGREISLNLANPKPDLTAAMVAPVMQQIVDNHLFTSNTGELIQVVDGGVGASIFVQHSAGSF